MNGEEPFFTIQGQSGIKLMYRKESVRKLIDEDISRYEEKEDIDEVIAYNRRL